MIRLTDETLEYLADLYLEYRGLGNIPFGVFVDRWLETEERKIRWQE